MDKRASTGEENVTGRGWKLSWVVITLAVLLSAAAAISLLRPEPWRKPLNTYVTANPEITQPRLVERAEHPEAFTAALSSGVAGEGDDAPAYPPRRLWCTLLIEDDRYRLIYILEHERGNLLVHEAATGVDDPDLGVILGKVGCETVWQEIYFAPANLP